MGVKVTNNAHSTLAGTLTSVATSLSVQAGHGARFPTASVASGDYFFITLIKTSGDLEIVKVTDRTVDTFTITRAQDDTTAREFALNDRVELRPVAALFNALPNRQLVTADYADASVTTVKLAGSGVTAGTYGGLGKDLTMAVNSKGQVTSISETSGIVQTDTFSFTTAGAVQAWTKPAVGSLVRVQLWGGGGGGARGGSPYGYGGGGGGGYVEAWYKLDDLNSTADIVVGDGGLGATGTAAGANGTNSTFTSGVTLTAYAGRGGSNGQDGGGGGGAHSAGGAPTGGRMGGGRGGYDDGTSQFPAEDAGTIWGGGGGGFGDTAAASSLCHGGYAVWGGGGGGGGFNGSGTSPGGASIFGGSGGAGATDVTVGSPGATPGGGGGGSETANAGNGGKGRCVVTVY